MGNIASTVHHRYQSQSQKPPHFSENRNSESQSQYFCQVDENKQMNDLPYFINKPQNYCICMLTPFAKKKQLEITKHSNLRQCLCFYLIWFITEFRLEMEHNNSQIFKRFMRKRYFEIYTNLSKN